MPFGYLQRAILILFILLVLIVIKKVFLMNVVLTGATGFVGGRLLEVMSAKKIVVIGRTRPGRLGQNDFHQAEIGAGGDFFDALKGVDVVVHSAARAHVMGESAQDPLAEYRKVNTVGTLKLASQAAEAGVGRFVFVSSIKVNGESTVEGKPFTPDDDFVPSDAYGLSKYEAERGLREIARETGMEVVIIRPPLVYGPGVKANFASMMRWVNRGVPLPLGGIKNNKRSLVALDNLVDLIVVCTEHPKAANQTFLVSDGEDMSTAELLGRMAKALGVGDRTIPVPVHWLQFIARLLGKPAVVQRLCSSLCVDMSKTVDLLGWKPPCSVDGALNDTAVSFLQVSK